mmetsp:Transcript_5587/g.6744  ORF Transcript_5587/g.6744 Transcript_5587/m.6744 type:complete len:188 (-) Transcript_5587:1813-2376(-)
MPDISESDEKELLSSIEKLASEFRITSNSFWKAFLHRVCDHLCDRLEAKEFTLCNSAYRLHNLDKGKTLILKAIGIPEEKRYTDSSVVSTVQKDFFAVVSERRQEVSQVLYRKTALHSKPVLADFDWSVRLILGGDTLSSTCVPVCQLQLQVANPGGQRRNTTVEMSLNELDNVLAVFEEALLQLDG